MALRGLRLGLAVLAVAGLGAAPPAADYWPGQAIVRAHAWAILGDADAFFTELAPHARRPSSLQARHLTDAAILKAPMTLVREEAGRYSLLALGHDPHIVLRDAVSGDAAAIKLRVIRSWMPVATPSTSCRANASMARRRSASHTIPNAVRSRRGRFRKPPCSLGGSPPRPQNMTPYPRAMRPSVPATSAGTG